MIELILSDLHLAEKDFNIDFKLTSWLDKQDFDRLYLAGDIWDVWKSRLSDIIRSTPCFTDFVKSNHDRVYFIQGNHDPDIGQLINYFPNLNISTQSMELQNGICVCHGHKLDEAVTTFSPIAKIAYKLHLFMLKRGVNLQKYFDRTIKSVAAYKGHHAYEGIVSDLVEDTIKYYKQLGARGLIMGHTHDPKVVDINGFVYGNSGDLRDNRTYIVNDELKMRLEHFPLWT